MLEVSADTKRGTPTTSDLAYQSSTWGHMTTVTAAACLLLHLESCLAHTTITHALNTGTAVHHMHAAQFSKHVV